MNCLLPTFSRPSFRQIIALITMTHLTLGSCIYPLNAVAHNGDGCEITGAAVSGTQVLSDRPIGNDNTITDSLWGNLLLSMAYQRDPDIQKNAKRLRRVNQLTLLSITGVTVLGLGQSISSYIDSNKTVGEHEEHREGSSKLSSTLGLIGSGATVGALGLNAILKHRYGKRITKRQEAIQHEVTDILDAFEHGDTSEPVQEQLLALVGDRARREFMQIWSSTHPAVTADSLEENNLIPLKSDSDQHI